MEHKVKATILTRMKMRCYRLNKCHLIHKKQHGMAAINAANISQYYSISQYEYLRRQVLKAVQLSS